MLEDRLGLNYRPLEFEESELMYQAKQAASEFLDLLAQTKKSREHELAIARMEEALMWACKHIAIHGVK